MININLFEKKEINRLPFVIIIIFLILLSGLFIYLFGMNRFYTLKDNRNMQVIENQVSEIQDARSIELLNNQVIQLNESLTSLESARYQIPFLIKDLHTYVPEESQIAEFVLLEDFTLVLKVSGVDYDALTALIKELNEIDYVNSAELSTLSVTESDTNTFDSEILLTLDQLLLRKENNNEN
ncbi:hypothetical protein [Marinilactibacillus sp. Marseille-P9653]|uniref:hypothetical protein n=1 Tax=Marinilactibacillus sp. Marseille-P9653 TaxID=2866583 RepID=UPI001CE482C4|nr:hypothetical protein [Marinilactibacillus sp. Marseille-P9653]